MLPSPYARPDSPYSVTDSPYGQPRRGLLGTIVHETVRDVQGAGKVALATGGEFAELIGLNMPVTWEDVEARDIRGFLMVAAMGAGGFAARGAASLAPIRAMGGAGTWLGRAGATASAEMASGAAFGLIRPLDEDEERLGAVIGDTMLFGAFGAGASMAKSAIKGVIGGKVAQIKDASHRALIAQAATKLDEEAFAREIAGEVLHNPETGAVARLRRDARNINKVVVDIQDGSGKLVPGSLKRYNDFNEALAFAVGEGYTTRGTVFREGLTKAAQEKLGTAGGALGQIQEAEGVIVDALGRAQLGQYRAVQEAARAAQEAHVELAGILTEAQAPAGTWTKAALGTNTRSALIKELGWLPPVAAKASDADVLKEAARRGLVTIETQQAGISADSLVRELLLNEALPEAATVQPARHIDSFLTKVLTPLTLGKLHPIVLPVVQNARQRMIALEKGLVDNLAWLDDLKLKVPLPKAEAAVEIIDASMYGPNGVRTVEEATEAAILAARSTGDADVVAFVEAATTKLGEYRQKLIAQGRIEEGLPGYFPIVNGNKWKLELTDTAGADLLKFQGFYDSRAEALARLAALREANPQISASLSQAGFWFEQDALVGMDPRQFSALIKAMGAVAEELRPADLRGVAEEFVRVQRTMVGRKTAGNIRPRVLGIRDFSKDPYESLGVYINTVERALAFDDFARQAEQVIQQIPDSQSNIRAWLKQYVADITGKPRPVEQQFDRLMEAMGADVQPRALKRYTTVLRKWQSFSRLGGWFSGVVNTSQIALNTYPVLGAKWTGAGLQVIHPKTFQLARKTLLEQGVDIGLYAPLSAEGFTTFFDSPIRALKDKRYAEAAQRMALFVFNGAEKMNRLTTAWGAYQKALSEGASKQGAAAAAEAAVARTQFVYDLSNTPELLRGPVGAVLLQFKSFFINEVEFIASLRGAEIPRFLAAGTALGGVGVLTSVPGADLVDKASGLFFDKKVSEALNLKADSDNPLSRAAFFGAPGLVGLDMSDYVGIPSFRDITRGVLGPTGSDTAALFTYIRDAAIDYKSGGFVRDETTTALLQRVMPSTVRRVTRGIEIAQTGEVRNAYTGKLIYQPDNRAEAALAQIFGAPTIRMSQERIMDQVTTRVRDQYVNTRASFAKEAAKAVREGRYEDAQYVMREAAATGFPLDQRTIQYYIRDFGRNAADRRMRRLPKMLRKDWEELYEATGRLEPPR